jgi:uncharacterized protein (TIGR02145 family)
MKYFTIILFLYVKASTFAQTGIGTTTPHASAQLEVSSTTKGFLPPRLTTGQRDAIANPADGLIIYNTTTNTLEYKTASAWVSLISNPNGVNSGEMQYWDGSAWVVIPSSTNDGAILTVVDGIPTWVDGTQPVQSVTSSNGVIWMDRNLGASQVATSTTDANSYGDLYQWGRGTDGHQLRTSGTTTVLSSTDAPGHAYFITTGFSYGDWRSPQNDNLWQGVNGLNNPCPNGYRLPTVAEWEAERATWSSNEAAGAFASLLKLPAAYARDSREDGPINDWYDYGSYWSSSMNAEYLEFDDGDASVKMSNSRADGYSVRCIKD